MLGSMSDHHDQLDPAEALMREVGAQLRQVRLERGQDLEEVGQHLRIKATYLLGIEQGDLSAIPGRTYALGFLRSYADYLGFDGDDLIIQIKSTVANLTDRTRLRMRTPFPESRLPKTPILVLSLAAVAGIYAGWSYLNHGSQLVLGTVAEVPANLRDLAGTLRGDGEQVGPPAADTTRAPPLPSPATTGPGARESRSAAVRDAPLPAAGVSSSSAAPGDPAPTAALPPVAAPAPASAAMTVAPTAGAKPEAPAVPAITPQAAPEPAIEAARAQPMAGPEVTSDAPQRSTSPAAADQPPAEPASPDRAAVAGAPATEDASVTHRDQLAALPFDPAAIGPVGPIDEPENRDARVVLRATESSWVRISSPGGDYVRDRTLEPNEVFLVPNRPDLVLWTGNAGGLQVIVDGTVLTPLGTSGAVLKDVSLEPVSLRTRLEPPAGR